MALPLFSLNSKLESFDDIGELVSEGPHDEAKGATDSQFQIPEGHVILTIWRGKLHCIIYQTPLDNKKAIKKRNAELFKHYGEGQPWNEILDNGFGKTYRGEDMKRFALWSYAMDFNTFGTMAFHKVMW